MPLSPQHLAIIKATAPVVAENAIKITSTFYGMMFKNDPVVLNFFNPVHQQANGGEAHQPRALADALIAYALNIDQLQNLTAAVELMAMKHCALMVKPEHYDIVARNLMAAIHHVLGAAVTQDVHDAWVAAYTQLAGVLIGREKAIYAEQIAAPGGWNGYRDFVVAKIVDEASNVKSFYFSPRDGKPVCSFLPGQYLTVHFDSIKGVKPIAPRNYSITSNPQDAHLRISVKRIPNGVVSEHMHDELKEGSVIQVGPPCGEFLYKPAETPVVFVSGGIGVTPLMSMLAAAQAQGRRVRWIHTGHGNLKFVDAALANGVELQYTTNTAKKGARISAAKLMSLVPDIAQCDTFVCGPRTMVVDIVGGLLGGGVPAQKVHFEFFGPKATIVPSAAGAMKCPVAH